MLSRSIKTAAVLLKSNGVSLFRNASGEFQIRLCNSARNAPYYFTDDLDDAVTTGLAMAQRRDAEQPQSPWQVMQARQPLWSAEDEKRITEKREKERARYAHLPETAAAESANA